MLPKPDWIDKSPSDWPPAARIAWLIMAQAAERRLIAEATKQVDAKANTARSA